MKKIYFIRHAKSCWSQVNLSDFNRPLNERGKQNVVLIGERLKKYSILPDIIISSSAKRAKKTSIGIAKIIQYPQDKIYFNEDLYACTTLKFLEIINGINDKNEEVFIVAHNPAITEICEILSNSIIGNIPTCGIVCIEFDIESFASIKEKTGRVLFFDYPKKHIL